MPPSSSRGFRAPRWSRERGERRNGRAQPSSRRSAATSDASRRPATIAPPGFEGGPSTSSTPTSVAPPPALAAAAWRRNFTWVWAANFLTAIGMMAFLPLFPMHLRELGMADGPALNLWSGALVAGAPLTAALMGPVWGALGDRIGRKPMMLRANVAITFFTACMWFARTPTQLFALRLLQGCFSGFIAPAMTLVSLQAPADRQGRIAGLLHTSVLAGNIVGPALGGEVGDLFSYRAAFLFCAALSLVALVLVHFGVLEPAAARRTATGSPGRSATLRHALAEARSFLAPGPLRTMVGGVFAVRVGGALPEPVLALFVGTLAGASADHAGRVSGIVFTAVALATLVVAPVWGRLGDERGHVRLLVVCAVAAALALLPQACVGHVAQLFALRFATGVFLAGVLPSAYGQAARLSSEERRGAANGFMFAAIGLANAIGPLLGGAISAWFGLRAVFVAGALVVLTGAGWIALRRRAFHPSRAPASVLLAAGALTAGLALGGCVARAPVEAPWHELLAGPGPELPAGCEVVASGGTGPIEFGDGRLVLGQGEPLTAVRFTQPLAHEEYELELVAARLVGNDFFAALTFPVGDDALTLVLGGWGGALCGLSCIDGEDAARNATRSFRRFERGRDCKVRVRVSGGHVVVTIDGEPLVDLDRRDYRLGLRTEVVGCAPLGIASWQTRGAIRSLRWRPLGQ